MLTHSYYDEDPRVRREAEALVACGRPVDVFALDVHQCRRGEIVDPADRAAITAVIVRQRRAVGAEGQPITTTRLRGPRCLGADRDGQPRAEQHPSLRGSCAHRVLTNIRVPMVRSSAACAARSAFATGKNAMT